MTLIYTDFFRLYLRKICVIGVLFLTRICENFVTPPKQLLPNVKSG